MIAKGIGKRTAERLIANQHVGHSRAFPDLKHRYAGGYEGRPVIDRFQRHLADPEWYQRRCMSVNDRNDIRPCLVDFAVNESFGVKRPASRVDRIAVEIEFHD